MSTAAAPISDQAGYGQIYLADLPEDIESLPLLDDCPS